MPDIEHVIDAVYETALDHAVWPEALALISGAFGGKPSQVTIVDTAAGHVPFLLGVDIDQASFDRFVEAYSGLDNPMMRLAMTAPLHTAVDQGAELGLTNFMRSDFYNEVYRYQDMLPFLGFVSIRSQTAFGGVAIMRATHGPLPDAEDFARANSLSRHVARAVEIGGLFAPADRASGSFEAALEKVREPVLLLSADGMVIWRNQAADDLLNAGDGITLQAHRLRAGRGEDQKAIGAALDVAAAGADASVTLARPSGLPPLILRAKPLWRRFADRRVRILVTLSEARIALRLPAEAAADLFGLTLAEARVVCEICAGPGGLSGAAQRLNLSRNTAKTYLQRAFSKTGARTQSELAILLATSLGIF